jgi:hypothetical protein
MAINILFIHIILKAARLFVDVLYKKPPILMAA